MSKKKRDKRKRKNKMHVNNQSKINKIVATEPDYWETEVECISNCDKAPENICVWIHPLVKEKIEALMEEYTNIEWLAYLLGEFGEKIEVSDIFIPDQEISAGSVDNIVCKEFNNLSIIGVIHSHHTMGNSFSHTDDTYINQNHNISLCISKDGINGHVRWETPCGSYKIVNSIVKIKTKSVLNKDVFIKAAKEKIKRKTFQKVQTNVFYGGYPGGYDGHSPPGAFVNKHAIYKKSSHNLNNILTESDVEELENEIEEINFSKEKTIEEEIDLMNEMEQISTDFDGPEENFI